MDNVPQNNLKGRYFSPRDIRLINSINRELYDNVLQIEVIVYRVCAEKTDINIYGEKSVKTPRSYYPGIKLTCIVNKEEMGTNVDDFGPNRNQNAVFCFRELALKQVNYFPQVDDVIQYFQQLYSIDNVVREQFLGGIPEKTFSIQCHTHYSRLSLTDLIIRQS